MEERLQKYMAKCGVASRRKCELLITEGKVKVNGLCVKELGIKVTPNVDVVEYNDKIIVPEEKKVYLMLYKPEGYITSLNDEKGRKTIIDLININERVFPIGRLDYDSSGLLLLTNDGDIYNKIIHPRVKIKKKYIAVVKGRFTQKEVDLFMNGVDIGGYVTANCEIKEISFENNNSTVEIIIHEGKNRQIRKMCSVFNHNIISLKRISVGNIKLGYLKKGEYRELTKDELNYINSL